MAPCADLEPIPLRTAEALALGWRRRARMVRAPQRRFVAGVLEEERLDHERIQRAHHLGQGGHTR